MEDEVQEVEASKSYLDLIQEGEKAFETYQSKCTTIDGKYASLEKLSSNAGDREFQIFWANLEVLKPTIYSRPPRPVVDVRHNIREAVPRAAAEVLQRVVEVDVDHDDLHDTLKLVRDDLATSARGVAWVLDNGHCIHVDREDFLHEPARKWAEVGWVARRAYMGRDAMRERFPEVDLTVIKFEEVRDEQTEYKGEKKAAVWEMWLRSKDKVVWVTEGYPDTLDVQPPLVDVKGFFPCPRPAYGTLERKTLRPVPDYVYYRDQCDEINELTARISSLSESLRLKGFYSSGASEVGEAIEAAMASTDNKALLVPVSNAAALGGVALKDSIIWLPVREVAEVITALVALRRQLIEDVYEITGLSDIMRGTTQASETATAQNLKAQYGSVRVRERQAEMVRVARDILRLKAEIYAEKVPTADLVRMALYQPPNDAPIEAIDALLKSERMRPFVLDVESDSTIAPDEQAEKDSRMEFLAAISQFLNQAGPMVAAQPQAAPFLAELMKFTAGGFRAGREIGGAIDDFADQMAQLAQQAQENKEPSPEQVKAQAEAQKMAQELQMQAAEFKRTSAEKTVDISLRREQMRLEQEKTRAEIALIEAKILQMQASHAA